MYYFEILNLKEIVLERWWSFGTVCPCRSWGFKNIRVQSWRSKEKLLTRPDSTLMRLGSGDPADFFPTSNFDLLYFCSLLTYKDAQYLIWKI